MKNEKGITLIALVITIIVLLILAGVSIAMLTGENGILTKASGASEKSTVAEIDEALKLGLSEILANKMDPTYVSKADSLGNKVDVASLTKAMAENNANIEKLEKDTAHFDVSLNSSESGSGEDRQPAKFKITYTGKNGTKYEWIVLDTGKIESRPTILESPSSSSAGAG